MIVPALAVVAGAVGVGLAVAGRVGSSGSRRSASHVVDQGRFVRGLVLNRTTRDGRVTPHWGIDIAAPEGTPIHAVKAGTVIFSRPLRGYGNSVMISHRDERRSSLYGHMNQATVQEGQQVTAGQVIGTVGSTRHGRNVQWDAGAGSFISTGVESAGAVSAPISPHLHMEIHPTQVPQLGPRPQRLDPVRYLQNEGIAQYARRWEPSENPRVA